MTTSKQNDDKERRESLENDRKVREQQGGTFFQHAVSSADDEAGGRFARVNPTMVVGSTPGPSYPQLPASSPWAHDYVPNEEPLGYSVNDLEHATGFASAPAAQVGPAPDAPPLVDSGEQRGVGPLSRPPEDGTNG
jgi:hypothetical protein